MPHDRDSARSGPWESAVPRTRAERVGTARAEAGAAAGDRVGDPERGGQPHHRQPPGPFQLGQQPPHDRLPDRRRAGGGSQRRARPRPTQGRRPEEGPRAAGGHAPAVPGRARSGAGGAPEALAHAEERGRRRHHPHRPLGRPRRVRSGPADEGARPQPPAEDRGPVDARDLRRSAALAAGGAPRRRGRHFRFDRRGYGCRRDRRGGDRQRGHRLLHRERRREDDGVAQGPRAPHGRGRARRAGDLQCTRTPRR